jgi:hypothetical protein
MSLRTSLRITELGGGALSPTELSGVLPAPTWEFLMKKPVINCHCRALRRSEL